MTWLYLIAALVSLPCLILATLFALWAAGRALPEEDRAGLAREIGRTEATAAAHRPGQRAAPTPTMLWTMSTILAVAAVLPWGLVAPPAIGRWDFVFPAFGTAFAIVFFTHGAGAWGVEIPNAYHVNDRRFFAPLALALAAGYAVLVVAWFL